MTLFQIGFQIISTELEISSILFLVILYIMSSDNFIVIHKKSITMRNVIAKDKEIR